MPSDSKLFRAAIALSLALACQVEAKTTVTRKPFGKTAEGVAVDLYTLKNEKIETTITTYGGRIVTLKVPDRKGKVADVVLGFDSLDGYLKTNPYFGAIVGRYANRIAHGKFVLDGKTFLIPKNDGDNALHGGLKAFDKQVWDAKIQDDSLVLHYLSKDGEEGFPGNLSVTVTYSLTGSDLKIDYEATTDKDTVLNLSNHSYFNLKGQGEGTVLDHEVTLLADRFTPVDRL